jgi:hypothetical protein
MPPFHDATHPFLFFDCVLGAQVATSTTTMTELGEGKDMLAEDRNGMEGAYLGAHTAVSACTFIYIWNRNIDGFDASYDRF